MPVDFEADESWLERLVAPGFDTTRPAIVASAGVSVYLTREAMAGTLRQVATLAPGSTLAMTFIIPDERTQHREVQKNARASGTPFLSFFTPPEMLSMARDAGFRHVENVSADDLTQRYFIGRTDDLRPSSAEAFLIATT